MSTLFHPRLSRSLLISALSGAFLITGCANMDETQRGTATGAAIGTVLGAAIGSATGGKNTVRGAALGAAAGAIAGKVAPVASACFGIYILLILVNYLRGAETEPVMDFFLRMASFAIVIGLGLNAGNYTSTVIPMG